MPPIIQDRAADEARYRQAPEAVAEVSGGDLLLVHLGHGGTYRLNGTGRAVWVRAVAGATPSAIARELAALYAVPEERLRDDVHAVLADLEANRLIERRGDAA